MHANLGPGPRQLLQDRPVGHLLVGLLLAVSLSLTSATSAQATWGCEAAPLVAHRPGTLLLADTFESGSLWRWNVADDGDAWAGVSNTRSHSGNCAGRMTVTSASTSRANVRKSLPSGTDAVWAVGWFRVDKQGTWGSNVPTFRFFNGSARILDVHRQNVSGDLWLRTASGSGSWRYVKLGRKMEPYRWYKVEVHVRTAWASSTISVWLNGTELYRTTSASLPASRLTTVMIGAEHARQVMDLSFDNVILTAP